MRRPILMFPDPRLRLACRPVERFDTELKTFADDLHDTMTAAPGVGITAAHVGVLERVVVLDLAELGGRRDFVNPRILTLSDDLMEHDEGSVSMPGAIEKVTRPRAIRLAYQNLDGSAHEIDLEGFPAICMQHEIDQLDGVFWIQRLSRLKRERLVKKWEKGRRT